MPSFYTVLDYSILAQILSIDSIRDNDANFFLLKFHNALN